MSAVSNINAISSLCCSCLSHGLLCAGSTLCLLTMTKHRYLFFLKINPRCETEFAKDASFGYKSSNLKEVPLHSLTCISPLQVNEFLA
jgi:hypothetical protein